MTRLTELEALPIEEVKEMDFRDWYVSTYGVGNDFERIVAKAAWDTALKHSNEIASLREQLSNMTAVAAQLEKEWDEAAKGFDSAWNTGEVFITKAEAKELADAYRCLDELAAVVLAVCCDPEGRVVIRGSDGDRAVLQAAIAKVGADETGTKERDELVAALKLWQRAAVNSEESELDEYACYCVPMPLFCDAEEATEAALAKVGEKL